jgi:Cu/Zn superoxide dismutase
VHVAVVVADAPSGDKDVRLYSAKHCDDIPGVSEGDESASPLGTVSDQGELGSMSVGQSGSAVLETFLPGASLQPNQAGSLLGKVMVIREEQDRSTLNGQGTAIACAMITPSAE